MSITLYDLSVQSFLQILPASINTLNKGLEHFGEDKMNDLLDARMIDDMWPLRLQIQSVRHHSIGAIEGIKRGEFNPPVKLAEMDFNDYLQYLKTAKLALEALTEEEVNEYTGKPVHFVMGTVNLPFTAENFVMSFSLPNLNFHAATLYNLLRKEGLELSKPDYMGKLRLNK